MATSTVANIDNYQVFRSVDPLEPKDDLDSNIDKHSGSSDPSYPSYDPSYDPSEASDSDSAVSLEQVILD